MLWSKLDLTIKRTDLFVQTWLQRAKGTALAIISAGWESAGTLAMLSSRTRQITTLSLIYHNWAEVQRFAEATDGPLPILHNLKIHVTGYDPLGPEITTRPSLPMFNGAVNLKEFALCAEGLPHLIHFTFPNLTTFVLMVIPEGTFSDEESLPTLQLLNFLESTPTLQIVSLEIHVETSSANVPPKKIINLPHVKRFHSTEIEPGYKIAAHISCPSAEYASLVRAQDAGNPIPQDAFYTSVTWNAVPRQYMETQIDAIVLELDAFQEVSCSLSFTSPGPVTFQLGYKIMVTEEGVRDLRSAPQTGYLQVFSWASSAIRNHPLLANVRRLRIQDKHIPLTEDQLKYVAENVGQLSGSLGPLDELALDVSDLRPYLAPFIDLPNVHSMRPTFVYPKIARLVVADQSPRTLEVALKVGILRFAKSQYESGVPFEHVEFQMKIPPVETVGLLQQWVGSVHCQ